jgi:tetratricopeptide (TPR) repeat protein
VALLVALVVLLVVARSPGDAEVAASLARIEQLIARGQPDTARRELGALIAAHPDAARAHFLLGNLDFASGDREKALLDWKRAVQLDADYKDDEAMRASVASLLDRRGEGQAALALLVDDIGKEALPEVVTCARLCKDEKIRRRAVESAVRLGGPKLLAEEGRPVADEEDELADKLRNGKGCRERKAAALKLIATEDRRWLDSLRAARDRRGGFLGLEEVNACMRRELDAAIRKLESK